MRCVLNFLMRSMGNLFKRFFRRRFFHPSHIGRSGFGWSVGPVRSINGYVWSWASPAVVHWSLAAGRAHDKPTAKIQFDCQHVYRWWLDVGIRVWCPRCGYELFDYKWVDRRSDCSGFSMLVVCHTCHLNSVLYGRGCDKLVGNSKSGTTSSLTRRCPTFWSVFEFGRSELVMSFLMELERRFDELVLTLDPEWSRTSGSAVINFWNKSGFWLCSVSFTVDDPIVVFSYVVAWFEESYSDGDVCTKKHMIGRDLDAFEVHILNEAGVPFYYDLRCPGSVDELMAAIAKVVDKYCDDYSVLTGYDHLMRVLK